MSDENKFEVIVIGGGHAGTEAALVAARMGCQTLLLTHNIETLGQMSCNPAIGGIGKGHLVKEIDALGGAMAEAIDISGIQFRKLNASKGPAVQATRAQADRALYKQAIRKKLENQNNLWIFQAAVDDLIIENDRIIGVITQMGLRFYAKAIVLTAGTFLSGKIHVGQVNYSGGRAGDPASITLAARLNDLPFNIARLKTGTPPRIDGRTIEYSKCEIQHSDDPLPLFSFMKSNINPPQQLPCYITHTTQETQDIIQQNLHKSAMYSGAIEGVGPRYCPSIEDKIVRFENKCHQIFIEPEGLNTTEIYPNGISTSLPYEVQQLFVRSITGFEKAHITRPGYAIEYDFFDPRDLKPSLETKSFAGLFFAGQINGTTGYEEAAAQGIIAGMNAALYCQDKEAWSPKRHEAYIGVLIDDLITLGTQEPYRMFTSRAEYRLILREDNADLRLTEKGYQLGVVSDERWHAFNEKRNAIENEAARLKTLWAHPNQITGDAVEKLTEKTLSRETNGVELLRRPEIDYAQLMQIPGFKSSEIDAKVAEQVEVQIKYQGYIDRQQLDIERLARNEETTIPSNIDYKKVTGLSTEVIQKLTKTRPATIGQASRISGVTPAAISLLLIYLKKHKIHVTIEEE